MPLPEALALLRSDFFKKNASCTGNIPAFVNPKGNLEVQVQDIDYFLLFISFLFFEEKLLW